MWCLLGKRPSSCGRKCSRTVDTKTCQKLRGQLGTKLALCLGPCRRIIDVHGVVGRQHASMVIPVLKSGEQEVVPIVPLHDDGIR